MNDLIKYPEMNRITLLYPTPYILLGKELYWTEKRDGSQREGEANSYSK